MGSSPSAKIMWGVVLSEDPEYGVLSEATAEKLEALEENDCGFQELFGFTEKLVPCPKKFIGAPGRKADPEFCAWERDRDAWYARRDHAVPVEIVYVYSYDPECPKILGLKRTKIVADGSQKDITDVPLTRPEDFEVAAVGRFLDAIGFTGNRAIRLFLVPCYG